MPSTVARLEVARPVNPVLSELPVNARTLKTESGLTEDKLQYGSCTPSHGLLWFVECIYQSLFMFIENYLYRENIKKWVTLKSSTLKSMYDWQFCINGKCSSRWDSRTVKSRSVGTGHRVEFDRYEPRIAEVAWVAVWTSLRLSFNCNAYHYRAGNNLNIYF